MTTTKILLTQKASVVALSVFEKRAQMTARGKINGLSGSICLVVEPRPFVCKKFIQAMDIFLLVHHNTFSFGGCQMTFGESSRFSGF